MARIRRSFISAAAFWIISATFAAYAQQTPSSSSPSNTSLSKEVLRYVRVRASKVVLMHVRVIDGTGRDAVEDQNIVIEGSKITAIQPGSDVDAAQDTSVLDLRGYSMMPGIVGMHNHLFYIASPNLDSAWHESLPDVLPQMSFSAPRLYLAGGVTTMRTTGSVEPYMDLNLRREIDAGRLPGPHLDVTGPYVEGVGSFFLQVHELNGPEEARQFVNYWADRRVTSFKAFMNLTRAELKVVIGEAHKRNIKVTGHLCAVTYKEAAELGIDDLEHGFFVNTQLDPGKKPDVCSDSLGEYTLAHLEPGSAEARDLIETLVKHRVAITSTLPVFDSRRTLGRPPFAASGARCNVSTGARSVFVSEESAGKAEESLGWRFAGAGLAGAVQTWHGTGARIRIGGRIVISGA